MSHSIRRRPTAGITRPTGIAVALLSCFFFSTSGTFAKALLSGGWSASAVVTARIVGAALVLLIPTLLALKGRWWLLRDNLRLVVGFGAVAVAACQFFYFNALKSLPVGEALLLEYLSPMLVVLWIWLRHGRRPGRATVGGLVAAMTGLALVAGILGSTHSADPVGLGWGLAAAVCSASYFFLAVAGSDDLPPVVLVGGGMVVAAVLLLVGLGLGLLPMTWSSEAVDLAGMSITPVAPLTALVLVSTVAAYLLGIVATRAVGSKPMAFMALSEVLLAVVAAWVVLGEQPTGMQILGGAFIVAGACLVNLGEPTAEAPGDLAVVTVHDGEVARADAAAGSAVVLAGERVYAVTGSVGSGR